MNEIKISFTLSRDEVPDQIYNYCLVNNVCLEDYLSALYSVNFSDRLLLHHILYQNISSSLLNLLSKE